MSQFAVKTLALAIAGSLFLSGCATQTSTPSTEAQTDTESTTQQATEQEVVRPFPPETLYALLAAEIAGSRNRLDIALGNYVQQAQKTRDPKVAARATRIGHYVKAHQVTLSSALLWLELEPDNSEARLIAATELNHAGRLNEAFELSRQQLEARSTTLFQAIAARATKTTDIEREALESKYDALLVEYPDHPQLLLGKALFLQQRGELDQALGYSQKASDSQSDYIPAYILQSQLLQQQGKTPDALQLLSRQLVEHPDSKRLRLQYARLSSKHDLELAYEQFSILHKNNPRDADLALSLALVSKEIGETAEAEQLLSSLSGHPKHGSTANYYLGQLHEQQSEPELALEYYKQVEPGQDYMAALMRILELSLDAGDNRGAREHMKSVHSVFPEQAVQLYLIEAETLRKYDRLNDSSALLDRALDEHPNNTDLLYSRAMVHEQQNAIDLAEADLRKIIKYDPNNATALNALGYTLADRTERYAEALEFIQQAHQLKPDDAAITDSLGWVHYKLGNYEDAIIHLRQAYKDFPDPEVAAHLGEALWQSGDQESAKIIWREGLATDPKSDIIRTTLERLDANID